MILQSVWWYLAYALRYRDNRRIDAKTWILFGAPHDPSLGAEVFTHLDAAFRRKKTCVGNRWRRDATSVKGKGQEKYYYRAIDKQGQPIDFLLTATRETKAALRFLKKAMGQHGKPSLVHSDQSGANPAGLKQVQHDHHTRIKIRQGKYLNTTTEQVHRRLKRLTRPMLGFKPFQAAQRRLAGIEVRAMIKIRTEETTSGRQAISC